MIDTILSQSIKRNKHTRNMSKNNNKNPELGHWLIYTRLGCIRLGRTGCLVFGLEEFQHVLKNAIILLLFSCQLTSESISLSLHLSQLFLYPLISASFAILSCTKALTLLLNGTFLDEPGSLGVA